MRWCVSQRCRGRWRRTLAARFWSLWRAHCSIARSRFNVKYRQYGLRRLFVLYHIRLQSEERHQSRWHSHDGIAVISRLVFHPSALVTFLSLSDAILSIIYPWSSWSVFPGCHSLDSRRGSTVLKTKLQTSTCIFSRKGYRVTLNRNRQSRTLKSCIKTRVIWSTFAHSCSRYNRQALAFVGTLVSWLPYDAFRGFTCVIGTEEQE